MCYSSTKKVENIQVLYCGFLIPSVRRGRTHCRLEQEEQELGSGDWVGGEDTWGHKAIVGRVKTVVRLK